MILRISSIPFILLSKILLLHSVHIDQKIGISKTLRMSCPFLLKAPLLLLHSPKFDNNVTYSHHWIDHAKITKSLSHLIGCRQRLIFFKLDKNYGLASFIVNCQPDVIIWAWFMCMPISDTWWRKTERVFKTWSPWCTLRKGAQFVRACLVTDEKFVRNL